MANGINSIELMKALRRMGIDVDNTSKVIIEISHNAPVTVHTQGMATSDLLGVVKAIDGDISVVRESAPEGGN